MPVIEGLVDSAGNVVRARGSFRVVRKTPTKLEIEFPAQDMARAFVLATTWRDDGDIGTYKASISVSPSLELPTHMIFAVDQYYGVSFRVDTDP